MVFRSYPQVVQRFFNINWFGPPPRVTGGSACPRIDHPASGLPRSTSRAVRTRFRFGSDIVLTSLPRGNSQAHYAKGMRSPARGSRSLGAHDFRVCFTPFKRVLFTFPSRYSCTIGRRRYSALWDGPHGFGRGFTCPGLLGCSQARASASRTGLSPSLAGLSRPLRSLSPPPCGNPATPADRSAGLGLVRFRSPLLAESLLISSPRGTEMFHFPRLASAAYGFSCGCSGTDRCGLLHSETRGSKTACVSPRTIAACRVLRRPSPPRHPSCARTACPPIIPIGVHACPGARGPQPRAFVAVPARLAANGPP